MGIHAWVLYEKKETEIPAPLKSLLSKGIPTGFITDFIEHYKKLITK